MFSKVRSATRYNQQGNAPVVDVEIEVNRADWLDILALATPRTPALRITSLDHALTYLPFAVAIAFGGAYRARYGVVSSVSLLLLLIGAAFLRPVYYALRTRRPSTQERVRGIWEGNVNRVIPQSVRANRLLLDTLGKERARRTRTALVEAIYCAKLARQRRLSGKSQEAAEQAVVTFLRRYGLELQTVCLVGQGVLAGQVGSQLHFETKPDAENGDEVLKVTVIVVPDQQHDEKEQSDSLREASEVDAVSISHVDDKRTTSRIAPPIKLATDARYSPGTSKDLTLSRRRFAERIIRSGSWYSDPRVDSSAAVHRAVVVVHHNDEDPEHALTDLLAGTALEGGVTGRSLSRERGLLVARYRRLVRHPHSGGPLERARQAVEALGLERAVFNAKGAYFHFFECPIEADGVPVAEPSAYTLVVTRTKPTEYLGGIDELAERGLADTRFWAIRRAYDFKAGFVPTAHIAHEAKQTLQRLRDGATFCIDARNGEVYSLEYDHSLDQFVLGVSALSRNLFPAQPLETRPLGCWTEEDRAKASLATTRRRRFLVDEPYSELVEYVDHLASIMVGAHP